MSLRRFLAASAALGAALVPSAAAAEFVSTPVTIAYVGQPYVYEVAATGVGEVVITAPNGLPPWLTLTPTGNGTATLHGTPQAGDVGAGITLRSEDLTCRVFLVFCYRFQVFDIAILVNQPPAVVPPGIEDQSAVEGEPFSLDVGSAFSDPDGHALTFAAAGLPPSLSLSGSVVAGTPTLADADASPYEVRVTAGDGFGGQIEDTFTLTVAPLDRADLSLEPIEPAPSPALAGEPVEWTFTIANAGPSVSGAAELRVELRGTPVTLGDHACDEAVEQGVQRLVCPLDPIPSGELAAVAVTGVADGTGDVHVAAEVAPLGALPIDPAADNNRGAASLIVAESVSAEPAQALGEASLAVAGGDLDGDGFDDVALATPADAPAWLHLNLEDPESLHASLLESGDGRRGLSTVPLALGDAAANADVALADLDGDGDLDALVANGPGAPSQAFVNDGSGVLSPFATLGAADTDTRAVAVGDLDGDGFADAVFANAGANEVYMNASGRGFTPAPLAAAPRVAADVVLVDVDGDALPDLVFANEDGSATIHRNTGAAFAPPSEIETGPTTAVAAGDFDGDGRADLVFARAAAGPSGLPSNPVFLSDGNGGFAAGASLGASPTLDVLAADFDGDDDVDVVALNAGGAHQLFVGDGAGGFAPHPNVFVAPGARRGATARVGRMRGADVVVAGAGTAVFFNDSRGYLGLGDTSPPVIELLGPAEIELEVEAAYEDPGATATDDVDGAVTPAVDNRVDTKVIGSYTVTYTATDSAGNAAVPVTRTVRVEPRAASGGGGGGALDGVLAALLLAGLAALGSQGLILRGGARPSCTPRSTRSTRRPAAGG